MRVAVITALKRSLSDTDQLIITSRTAEFDYAIRKAGAVLTAALVIEPEPLSPVVAADYLHRCLPRCPTVGWQRILTEREFNAGFDPYVLNERTPVNASTADHRE